MAWSRPEGVRAFVLERRRAAFWHRRCGCGERLDGEGDDFLRWLFDTHLAMHAFETVGPPGGEWLVLRGPGIDIGHWDFVYQAVAIGAKDPNAPIPAKAWDPTAKAGWVSIGPDMWVEREVVTAALTLMYVRFATTNRASMAEKTQAAITELNSGSIVLRPAWLAARIRRRLDRALPSDI
jgi:hypothetical protein